MLLKKGDVNGRKSNFDRREVDFRSTSLHSLRSLQGLLCDAKSPRSDAGSTPIFSKLLQYI